MNYSRNKKEESANAKIFRPWDVQQHQDSTISTTTVDVQIKEEDTPAAAPEEECQTAFSAPTVTSIGTPYGSPQPRLENYPVYPEYFPVTLAQSLGLPSNDSLFLESLSQGYALEEYARVLNQEHQAKLQNSRKQRPKKYKCPHCNVGFSNNGQLKGHIRIHTGERPFKCDAENCGKTFTRNEELTRHKRIHSGVRPFACNQCGKCFGRKDHLKKHSKTHMQPRGLYAVPVMLPLDAWNAAASTSCHPYIPLPMFGY